MTTEKQLRNNLEIEKAKEELKELLRNAGYTVYTVVKRVSSSGMFRVIDCFVIVNNAPLHINWHIERLDLYKRDKKEEGLRVNGCGMDMGFSVVYNLSSVLYKNDFRCRGEGCPANDHTNDRTGEWDRAKNEGRLHSDGGYCLIQRWL